jgi:hypothetical protein
VREPVDEPSEDRLVVDVHPQRDVGLATVAPEVALPDQQPDEEAGVERTELGLAR